MPSNLRTRSALVARIREMLLQIYGHHCARCGCDLRGIPWEVNHKWPRDYQPRKLDFYGRNLRYFKEAQRGLIEPCCPECNSAYRPRSNPEPPPPEDYRCPKFEAWLANSKAETPF